MTDGSVNDPHLVVGKWEAFRAWAGGMARVGLIHNLYRGESNHTWPLRTSFHRMGKTYTLKQYITQIIPGIYDEVATIADRQWNLQNTYGFLSFLAFLQHHGFPTPLLDWTRSPYIAAYFAFEGVKDTGPESDNVSVYWFQVEDFVKAWKQMVDLEVDIPHVSVVPTSAMGNPKQHIQQGVFTFSTVDDLMVHMSGLEAAGQAEGKSIAPYIIEYQMPITEKPAALRDLTLMGITHTSLFPGVDGLCRALKQRYFQKETLFTPTTLKALAAFASSAAEKKSSSAKIPPSGGD